MILDCGLLYLPYIPLNACQIFLFLYLDGVRKQGLGHGMEFSIGLEEGPGSTATAQEHSFYWV